MPSTNPPEIAALLSAFFRIRDVFEAESTSAADLEQDMHIVIDISEE